MIDASRIGRVGGLAVALGIGSAMVGAPAIGWAAPETGPATVSSESSSSGPAERTMRPFTGKKTAAGCETCRTSVRKARPPAPPRPAVREPDDTAERHDDTDTLRERTRTVTENEDPATEPTPSITASTEPDPGSTPLQPVRTASARPAILAGLTEAVSNLFGLTARAGAGGELPADSPADWALLAWARRGAVTDPDSAQLTSVVSESTGAVGKKALGVAVSDTKIYVADSGSNTVSVVDRATGAVRTIPVVGTPRAVVISPDGSRAYVSGYKGVSVIDTGTDTVLSKVAINGGYSYGIAISGDGRRLYVSNAGNNTVSVIDATPAVPTVIATVKVGSAPRTLAVSADGASVYVANWNAKSVSVISTATNTNVGTIKVGANPFGVAAGADGMVYVANYGSNSVSVINPVTSVVTATIAVGSRPQSVAVSADGTVLYVAEGRDTVKLIATATRTVLTTIAIDKAPETDWHQLALSPDGRQLVVTDMADKLVRVLTLARPNGAPVAGTPTVGLPDPDTGVVTGSLNVTDPDGDVLTYTVTTPPRSGTVVVDASGTYTFTPGSVTGPMTFAVAVSDGRVATDTTVTVQAAPPVDSTGALQAMFDNLRPGDTLTLEARTYRYSGVLYVRVPGVTVNGNGATLAATDDLTAQLQILADGVTVHDLTMSSPLIESRSPISTIYIASDHVTIRDVTIDGSAGAGVYLTGAGYFDLDNVRVIRSLADGIHMTNGSHDGVINNAYTEWTGDDGIAVVSYRSDGVVSKNIVINNPVVNGTTWGRGVTVVGGENITYHNVTIANTDAAGVYIATEPSYDTYSVAEVQILGGTLVNCNTNPEVVHGGVLLWAGNPDTSISDVRIAGLTVSDTPGSATWILGLIKENGATLHHIALDTITLHQGLSMMPSYTNAPSGDYSLNQVLLNGIGLQVL